jgi:hypothetical protein
MKIIQAQNSQLISLQVLKKLSADEDNPGTKFPANQPPGI